MKLENLQLLAKSLQSCPTLCDPTDGSPPGSSFHGIFQARVLEWVAIPESLFYFFNYLFIFSTLLFLIISFNLKVLQPLGVSSRTQLCSNKLFFACTFKKINLFNWRVFYNIVVVFSIHQHESAMGAHMSSHPEHPSHLPPHLIPLVCPRAPALSALLHASTLHWSSILHMIIYMFQCFRSSHPTLASSHCVQKSVLYVCVSFAALHVRSLVPSF